MKNRRITKLYKSKMESRFAVSSLEGLEKKASAAGLRWVADGIRCLVSLYTGACRFSSWNIHALHAARSHLRSQIMRSVGSYNADDGVFTIKLEDIPRAVRKMAMVGVRVNRNSDGSRHFPAGSGEYDRTDQGWKHRIKYPSCFLHEMGERTPPENILPGWFLEGIRRSGDLAEFAKRGVFDLSSVGLDSNGM